MAAMFSGPVTPEERYDPTEPPLLETTVKFLLMDIRGMKMAVAVEDPRFLLQHSGYTTYSTGKTRTMGHVEFSIAPRTQETRPRVRYYIRYCCNKARWILSYVILAPGEPHPLDADVASAISIVGLASQDPKVVLRFGQPPCAPYVRFRWSPLSRRPSGVFRCVNDGTMIKVPHGDPEVTRHQFFVLGLPLIRKFAWNPKTELDFTKIAGLICQDEYERLMALESCPLERKPSPTGRTREQLEEEEKEQLLGEPVSLLAASTGSNTPLPPVTHEPLGPTLPPNPLSSTAAVASTAPPATRSKGTLTEFFERVGVTRPLTPKKAETPKVTITDSDGQIMDHIDTVDNDKDNERSKTPKHPLLTKRSLSWSGKLSMMEEKLEKLAIDAGQAGFMRLSPKKSESLPENSQRLGVSGPRGSQTQPEMEPPMTPKKEEAGFPWLSPKKTKASSSSDNVDILGTEHQIEMVPPMTPKKREQAGFPWLSLKSNQALSSSQNIHVSVLSREQAQLEMEPPSTPKKDRVSFRTPFSRRDTNTDKVNNKENEGKDKENINRKGKGKAVVERGDDWTGTGKENVIMRFNSSPLNDLVPERFPRDIGESSRHRQTEYGKKPESIADRFRSRMGKNSVSNAGQRATRFVPGTTILEDEAWIRANEAITTITLEPSRPLELSPFALRLEDELRRERQEAKRQEDMRRKALLRVNGRSNARRGKVGQAAVVAPDRATSLFGMPEPVTPPDPAYIDKVYDRIQMHSMTSAMRRELGREDRREGEPQEELDCSLMTEEQVFDAKVGGIKNWAQFPPVQVASEFIPESKKHWDWSALDSHGRDPFASVAGVQEHLQEVGADLDLEDLATF